jgi:hypothetical protein
MMRDEPFYDMSVRQSKLMRHSSLDQVLMNWSRGGGSSAPGVIV